ncbi:MAG: nucleotidyltransferase domain-containing protein [Candidatus Methanoperedens sp.]|nr:nucleotidyltransferase domain-containing protein [Candidatus Methanoperedens sp.]
MINKIVPELVSIFKQKFSHDLLSVVLFGSFVKGTFTSTSDIDVLIICNNLPKDWRERDRMALELTEDIEIKHTIPIHMVLISKNEISHAIESAYPLMLEIYDTNKIVYDKDNFFKRLLVEFEKNLGRWRAKKISKGVWRIPGLAVIESG